MPLRAVSSPSPRLEPASSRRIALLGALCAVTLLGSGCGAKAGLSTPAPWPDAGMADAFTPTLDVDCGRATRRVAVGRPFVVRGEVRASGTITSAGWRLREEPAGAMLSVPPGVEIGLTVPLAGDYVLDFEARDDAGNVGLCTVRLEARGGVVAVCPPEAEYIAGAGEPVLLEGDAFDPASMVEAAWTQTGGPAAAEIRVLGGAGTVVEVTATVPGLYTYVLRASTASGEDTCEVRVRITAPPNVACGGAVAARTRQPVTVSATAMDDDLASVRWEMVSRPASSTASLAPADQLSTTFTPDRRGEYVLRFTATDAAGESASCEVTVIAEPTPPDAICPATIDTRPLSTVTIEGSGVDDGTIVAAGWSLRSEPLGAASSPPSPADSARATFQPLLAGEYTLELAVRDDDGNVASCTTLVRAIATEGLRVEVFWNTDGTDMDTHLMRPGPDSMRWFSGDDCFYANCQGGGLGWPPDGSEDDPSLDIDDTNGFGPENINVTSPVDGTYRVAIDAFRGAANTTVRIYCGGSTTEPRQTFGPVFIDSGPNDLWRVADITISGGSCTIADLRTADGRPNIQPCSDCMR
ncbi:MAG: PKD domain-containing protein [Deltaproteobacteria bacterium]